MLNAQMKTINQLYPKEIIKLETNLKDFCSQYNFLALLLNHTVTLEIFSATTLAKAASPP